MTNSRKQYGIGSLAPDEKIVGKPGGIVEPGVKQYGIFKKIKKGIKKVVGSKAGKIGLAALALGVPWGAGAKLGSFGGQGWFGAQSGLGRGIGLARNLWGGGVDKLDPFHAKRTAGGLFSRAKKGLSDFGYGKAALIGGGVLASALPFMGQKDEEEEEEFPWSVTPSNIADIRNMARNRDPSLAFLPNQNYVQSGYYLADGGLARLANGGGPAEAQAEQMLKMEYQKYRNQGGTMSYQQFKMALLQQAQAYGPMAQELP